MAHTLFSNPDRNWHKTLRRSIQANFSRESALEYEPSIDSTIRVFVARLAQSFAGQENNNGIFDLHTWLLYATFDIMGDLTYSQRHGFIEQGRDVKGIIAYIKAFLGYGYIVRLTLIKWKDENLPIIYLTSTITGRADAHCRRIPPP